MIDSHSQSLVVITKNSEPIKNKEIISLTTLLPKNQKYVDVDLNQESSAQLKGKKQPLVTNLLQSVIKMPSLT